MRKDGERSMAELGLVNLKRIRDSLTGLKEQLDFLRFRVFDLGHERETGTFTGECSRLDLFEIARCLPPRTEWGLAAFDNVRNEVRSRFGLSSKAFARALDMIQRNPEMGAMIGVEFSLAHLTDDKVLQLLGAWGALFPPRPAVAGPILSSIVPPMSREERVQIGRQHATTDADILEMINDDELADLETIFYIGRDERYGEHYADRLTAKKREHAVHGDRRSKLHHLTSKGNLAQMLAAGSIRLGRPRLANRIYAWRPDLFPSG